MSRPFYNDHNKKVARRAESHKFERFYSTPDMSEFGFVQILGTNSGCMSMVHKTVSCAPHMWASMYTQSIIYNAIFYPPYMEMFCV
mgnify:CR=1 FL=1